METGIRKLLIFSVCFCTGTSLVLLRFPTVLYVGAISVLVLLAAFLIVKMRQERRLILIFTGLSVGILWNLCYQSLFVTPVTELDGFKTAITGEALDYSQPAPYGIAFEARLRVDGRTVRAKVWMDTNESLQPGDHFSLHARLADSAADGNYYGYGEGIYLYAYGTDTPKIIHCEEIPLSFLPQRIANRLENSLKQCMPEDVLGYATALTTGNRNMLTDSETANLKGAGIYHLMALSGMHMTALVGLLGLLIRKKKQRAFLGIPFCILFAVITGCSPSVVRACVMQCVLLISYPASREYDMPTSLGLAALLMVAQNPWCVASCGVQLSFLAVIGMTLFGQRLYKLFRGKRKIYGKNRRKLFSAIAASMAISTSALGATIPILIVDFGYISLISPLTNLLTGWVIGFVFVGGLMTAIIGTVVPIVGTITGWLTAWGFRYISAVAGIAVRVPFHILYTDSSGSIVWLILIYVLIAYVVLHPDMRKTIPVCLGAGASILGVLAILIGGSGFFLTALDVGQGQCIILHNGGGTAMVDCGGSCADPGAYAAEFLSSRGIGQVDLLILTHFDEDHVGGVLSLMQHIYISGILMPKTQCQQRTEIEQTALLYGTDIFYGDTDTEIYFGGGTISVFAPLDSGDDNISGLSLLCETEQASVLITGDMDAATERMLMHYEDLPEVDLLIAGHHGSKYSTSAELLTAVMPKTVIISVGQNNYGHPAAETLKRIQSVGAIIYRTDEMGTITWKGA